jgi:hypothetical protein
MMMASRGMGAIMPSKMPGPKRKARRDDTDFTQYAEGGEVWDKPNPAKKHKKLSSAKKSAAKAAAKAAGRPYPNLIDNMRMARSK